MYEGSRVPVGPAVYEHILYEYAVYEHVVNDQAVHEHAVYDLSALSR
jgi:hypothetical protein